MRGIGKIFTDFCIGVCLPFQALKLLLRSPRYWHYTTVPVLISLVVYVVFGFLYFYYFLPFAGSFIPDASHPGSFMAYLYSFLRILIEFAASILFIIIFVLTFTMFFFVAAAPFLERMVIRFEKERYNFEFHQGGIKQVSADTWKSTKYTLWLTFLITFWSIVLFPLPFFIPVAGFLPGTLVVGYLFGITCLIYSVCHRRIGWRVFKLQLRGNRSCVLGMGVISYFLLFIPFVAILFLPVSVLAGSILYNERLAEGAEPEKD